MVIRFHNNKKFKYYLFKEDNTFIVSTYKYNGDLIAEVKFKDQKRAFKEYNKLGQ